MNRKDFFEQALKSLLKKGLDLLETHPLINALENLASTPEQPVKKQRPPGASQEKHFQTLCTGCDACMIACPVNVIMIEDLSRRLPLLYPEKNPCINCPDYPCIRACPTGALNASHGTLLRLLE